MITMTAVCRTLVLPVLVAILVSSHHGATTTATTLGVVEAFAPAFQHRHQQQRRGRSTPRFPAEPTRPQQQQQQQRRRPSSSFCTSLAAVSSKITVPSQTECETLGIREWPQQSKTGSWTETVASGTGLVRYVLEGSGSVRIAGAQQQAVRVGPGTLVEIEIEDNDNDNDNDESSLVEWSSDSGKEMILLTPGFEEGGVFLGVLAGILVLFGALLSGALG